MTQSVDRVAIVEDGDGLQCEGGREEAPRPVTTTKPDEAVDAAADEHDTGETPTDEHDTGETPTDELGTAVEDAGARLVSPDRAEAILAVGERGVAAAAIRASETDTPMLPIGVGRLGAARSDASEAISALVTGDWQRTEHALLTVSAGSQGRLRARSALSVSLMTVETARISEYAVAFRSGRRETFRGDGVVVATPLGSDGYARTAGAPALEPGTGLTVTPVAPFRIQRRGWVVPGDATLSVEREGEPVAVAVDGIVRGEVRPQEPVRIRAGGTFDLVSVSQDGADDAPDWKNSNDSSTE
ncbi:NAD(+)/NADH kinase [Halorubrum vacuolatum]|uniref:NAD+ kinase n=1 Tax=Halorubrum vacuolatum TaxID=63740 RepID=A0A238WLG3_HALVU|nr:NAD(+)/NADH kinase [Halorubrum vacuolatum]SNR47382.1 NAD+ kinase [Halorubrum vacuolatum]